jgi:hypothetical protein
VTQAKVQSKRVKAASRRVAGSLHGDQVCHLSRPCSYLFQLHIHIRSHDYLLCAKEKNVRSNYSNKNREFAKYLTQNPLD